MTERAKRRKAYAAYLKAVPGHGRREASRRALLTYKDLGGRSPATIDFWTRHAEQ